MTALVFSVTIPSTFKVDIEAVFLRIDENGIAPKRAMHPAVTKKVKDGQITSSPGPTPFAIKDTIRIGFEETPTAISQDTTRLPLQKLNFRAKNEIS